MSWLAYDYYVYALVALLGTLAAAVGMIWVLGHDRWQRVFHDFAGISPQFMNLVGVLFALTLAFLANDTWSAHDKALAAIDHEADALRGIAVIARQLPPDDAARIGLALRRYAAAALDEWPLLARRQANPGAAEAADVLLTLVTSSRIVAASGPALSQAEIALATAVRDSRETRLALSQTHVNPLKWAGMAFLGFLTMLSVALVHLGAPRRMTLTVMLYALASAPTAFIVLVHGNPFAPPTAVASTPLVEFMTNDAKRGQIDSPQ